MNKIYKSLLFIFTVAAVVLVHSSCSEEDLPNDGMARIRYVRVTNPASSDSLLVSGFQGNWVAIVGDNLQKTTEIWVNDQRATLSPVFVTNTSILTILPSKIPEVITNKMALVFSSGDTLFHDFNIEISEPEITTMKSEYVLAGDVAVIRGDFFYEPLTVTFSGGVQGELVSVDETIMEVKVPEGAEPGPITVTTNFGVAKSNFWFLDNRNIFLSSDPYSGWWGESLVVTDPGADDPVSINGNYFRVKETIAGWSWKEAAGGPPDAMGDISKNIPDDAILNPDDYYLKFEVNTMLPYNSNVIKINVGLSDDFNNDEYRWMPPYDTKGEWQTVAIPLETVMSTFNTSVSADGYYARILFHGPGDLDCDMSFDNFRVVPKVLD